MIIMTQDRKHIIDCTHIEVTRNLGGGKSGKYAITASTMGFAGIVMLGTYAEEKNAMDELERIYMAFSNGEKCYTVR